MTIAIIIGEISLGVVSGIGIGAFLAGSVLAYFLFTALLKKRRDTLMKEAEAEAEVIKKDKILQAKEKFLQLKSEHDKNFNERNSKLVQAENKIKQKEISLNQKFEEAQRAKKEVDVIRENLNIQLEVLEKKHEEVDKLHRQQVEQLGIHNRAEICNLT
ncbi:MAG TPA: Rnase Y domain-containing protein [Bacteroidales bacterium]|nr:Rnase Y domain-containing protein [Bacteroidales bacterium]